MARAGTRGARRGAARPHRPGRRLVRHDRDLGLRLVAGVDEAGRGCLAGPLVVAAVVLDTMRLVGPDAAPFAYLDDSKKLAPDRRESLYHSVLASAVAWSVVSVSPGRIDRVGLHRCNIAAMHLALARLSCSADVALVDGFALDPATPPPGMPGLRPLDLECRQLVRGDGTSAAIAAASVLAKVTRDRLMCRLDGQLDGRWAFAEHVGYATPLHRERIELHGPSEHHRRSFASTAYEWVREAMAAGDLAAGEALAAPSEGITQVLDPLDVPVAIATDDHHVEAVPAHPLL